DGIASSCLEGNVIAQRGLDEHVRLGADVLADKDEPETTGGEEAFDLVALRDAAGGGVLLVLIETARDDGANKGACTLGELGPALDLALRPAAHAKVSSALVWSAVVLCSYSPAIVPHLRLCPSWTSSPGPKTRLLTVIAGRQ